VQLQVSINSWSALRLISDLRSSCIVVEHCQRKPDHATACSGPMQQKRAANGLGNGNFSSAHEPSCPPPAARRPPPAARRPPPAARRPPPAARRPPPAARRPPLAARRPPPAARRPPLAARRPLPAARGA
jgi:hypothetical protein